MCTQLKVFSKMGTGSQPNRRTAHTPLVVFYISLLQLVDTKEPDIQPSMPHHFTPEHNAANIKRNTHTRVRVCVVHDHTEDVLKSSLQLDLCVLYESIN